MARRSLLVFLALVSTACTKPTEYDLILRHGTLYDGSGQPPRVGDVAVNGDRIVKSGTLALRTERTRSTYPGSRSPPGSST